VAGGVRDRHARLPRQILHGPLALSQQVYELQTVRIRQRFPDPRELLEQLILEQPIFAIHVFNILVK
jgi:hypothetical protein